MSKATNVTAILVTGEDKLSQVRKQPGGFYYMENTEGIMHSCPCGCTHIEYLNLDPKSHRPCWVSSGSHERPTLKPSVGIKPYADQQDVESDGFHWHGWLQDGVWNSA